MSGDPLRSESIVCAAAQEPQSKRGGGTDHGQGNRDRFQRAASDVEKPMTIGSTNSCRLALTGWP
jgi:hypothetical protein